ncbi:MAG: Gfo/Idh/MocA family oxidoreductase [Phycisphaerae bacterium]|nr:Gfo/Idh/MocA family oxidoreductase [Phycisphaerae bacterium]
MAKLRTAVIGAGKMGRLHSRIYSEMENVELVAVVDNQIDKARAIVSEFGGTAYDDYNAIVDMVDAVTISAPTEHHAIVAEPFLSRGIPVLVEKPLAETLDQARHMRQLAQDNNTILQVGYSERFNPVNQAMAKLNFTPRFIEANRISPFTFRSTDVGVVLDLMIHDIDIILSMAKSKVADVQAIGVNVLGENEDIANVRLTFENGCVANLTASRMAMKTERKIRVFSESAYLVLDLFKKTGSIVSKTANIDMLKEIRGHLTADGQLDFTGMDWTKLVQYQELDITSKEPLRLEQEAFINAVSAGSTPEVSAADAVAAMELAQRITETIKEHRWHNADSSISSSAWDVD